MKVHYVGINASQNPELTFIVHVVIREFTCFHPFYLFSPRITISRSLEGKYTFLGGIWWVLGQGGQNR